MHTKAQQIETCLIAVSKYFNADPRKVLTSFGAYGAATRHARCLLWHHMHDCGMSFQSIGKIFGNCSIDHIQKRAKQGMMCLTEEDRLILATLPRIQNTLETSQAK